MSASMEWIPSSRGRSTAYRWNFRFDKVIVYLPILESQSPRQLASNGRLPAAVCSKNNDSLRHLSAFFPNETPDPLNANLPLFYLFLPTLVIRIGLPSSHREQVLIGDDVHP